MDIAKLIPHSGSMVLLDRVDTYDASSIVCSTRSHLSLGNPLRVRERLPACAGIEYAAQAGAIHGALLKGDAAKPGLLASVRSCRLRCDRLDRTDGDLKVTASILGLTRTTAAYRFLLADLRGELINGQLVIFFR